MEEYTKQKALVIDADMTAEVNHISYRRQI